MPKLQRKIKYEPKKLIEYQITGIITEGSWTRNFKKEIRNTQPYDISGFIDKMYSIDGIRTTLLHSEVKDVKITPIIYNEDTREIEEVKDNNPKKKLLDEMGKEILEVFKRYDEYIEQENTGYHKIDYLNKLTGKIIDCLIHAKTLYEEQ